MKVKLDENVTWQLVPLLSAAGHDVHTVADEDLGGRPDPDVWSACQREQRLLITSDVGFGDIRVYPPGQHAGVVLLRLDDQRPSAVLDVMARFMPEHSLDELAGQLVVLTEDKVRVRKA